MFKKILSMLTLAAYLTVSIALPVFAEGEGDEPVTKVINRDTEDVGDVEVERQANSLDPKTSGVIVTDSPGGGTVYHVADDPATSAQEGNLTVGTTSVNPGVDSVVISGALSVSGEHGHDASAVIDNDVNLNINTASTDPYSQHCVAEAKASPESSASLIVGGDVNLVDKVNVGTDTHVDTDGMSYGIRLDGTRGGDAGAAVFGDVNVSNFSGGMNSDGVPDIGIVRGVFSDIGTGGSSYVQVDGSITSNNMSSGANTMATGLEVYVKSSADHAGGIDENNISAARGQAPLQKDADGTLPRHIFGDGGIAPMADAARVCVGGDINVNALNTNGLTTNAKNGLIVADVGGKVTASGEKTAAGVSSAASPGGVSDTVIGGDVSAQAGMAAAGVYIYNQDGNQLNRVEVGGDVTASTTASVATDGSNYSRGIFIQDVHDENAGTVTGSNTDITVGGNVVARAANGNATGIYIEGQDLPDNDPLKKADIRVKGDVFSDGKGIEIKDYGNSKIDIVVEGTITGNNDTAVITSDGGTGQQFTLTVWKIENAQGTTEDSKLYADSLKRNVQYIIKVDSSEVSLEANSGTAWNNKKVLSNREGQADTVYNVAKENDRILLHIDKPDGKKIKKVFADADKTVEIQEVNGEYWLTVQRGGGALISVEFEDIAVDPVDSVDPVNPVDPSQSEQNDSADNIDPDVALVQPENIDNIVVSFDPDDNDDYDSNSQHSTENMTYRDGYIAFADQSKVLGIDENGYSTSIPYTEIDMGDKVMLSLNDILLWCVGDEYQDMRKILTFYFNGKKYIMVIPRISNYTDFINRLEMLKAEPGQQAHFMRVAEIFGYGVGEK